MERTKIYKLLVFPLRNVGGMVTSSKVKVAGIALAVLAVCAALLIVLHPWKTTFDAAKIHALLRPDNCAKAMPVLIHTKPNLKQTKESALMLSYRSGCYLQNRQYAKALSDTELMRTYYEKLHDKNGVASADNNSKVIKAIMTNLANPSKGKVRPEPVTPEFAKELREEN